MSKGIYNLDSTIMFGEHKGEAVVDVIDNDAQYITWCINTIDGFELDDIAFEYYQDIRDQS